MIPLLEPRVNVFIDSTAWTSWVTKATAAATGTPLIATVLEHNSAMVAMGNLMDELSDPARFVGARPSTPLGGNGILFAQYQGAEPPAFLMQTGSTLKYQGQRLPVVGAGVAPADHDRLVYWEAWREIVSRFGAKWTVSPFNPAPVQNLASQKMVLADGVVAEACIPLQQVRPNDNTMGIKEDPDAAKYVINLWNATTAYGLRLVNQAAGSNAAADMNQTAAEVAAIGQITAISNMYRAEHKSTSMLGAGVVAAAGALGLLLGGRSRSRSRKRGR